MREHKSLPAYTRAVRDRTYTGIFAVYGNVDDYSDISWPGMMAKTIRERGERILHLWQHNFDEPAIALIEEIREVGRDELPAEVLVRAPEALGGAEVTRTYLDTPRGNEVLANLQAGVPLEMSFAFDALRYDFEERDDSTYGVVRNLREIRLYETSDVLWGANSATVAQRRLSLPLLVALTERAAQPLKGGARHSAQDMRLINQIAELAVELGATSVRIATSDDDAESFPDHEAEEDAKTAAAEETRQRAVELARATGVVNRQRLRAAEAVLRLGRQ